MLVDHFLIFNILLVPFWSSIRVAIAFIGFLGMVTHFSQKTNISIGLVCMVNHSAIEHYHINSTKPQTISTNDDCPQTNNKKNIVTTKNKIFSYSFTFIHNRKVPSFGQKIFKVSS